MAIHISTDRSVFTFVGYEAPVNIFDVSNSNTPNHFDHSNPVTSTFQRAIGQLDSWNNIFVKPVDSYSGNNGRSAILSDCFYYMVDNAGNGTVKGAENTVKKWVLVGDTWQLAYTLTNGLNLGQPYAVVNYPTEVNPATGVDWAPATDGLRNIIGKHNDDGTVTIYAVTSTVSGATDQGGDPNRLESQIDFPSLQRQKL